MYKYWTCPCGVEHRLTAADPATADYACRYCDAKYDPAKATDTPADETPAAQRPVKPTLTTKPATAQE